MFYFMVVTCLISIAIAIPQYNYSPSIGSTSVIQQGFTTTGGSQLHSYDLSNSGSFDSGSSAAFNSFNSAPALPSASSVAAAYRARPVFKKRLLPPIVSKHIYYHAAQDEPDEEIYEDNSTEQQHRHYNVVFIKAPHQSVRKIAEQTSRALNEEKTAIYVLSKKNDISEIRQAVSDSPHHSTKPEVFFVKYKTPEEAQHAQQTIQAQYDALGGTTNVSNEGFAPVSSVVGALDVDNGSRSGYGTLISGFDGSILSSGGNNFISGGSNNAGSIAISYLPSSKV